MVIKQRQHIGEAINAKLAHDPMHWQVRPHLDHLRAGSGNFLDHAGLVAIFSQACLALGAAIGAGDRFEPSGDQLKDFVPRDAYELVATTIVELVRCAEFWLVGKRRKACIGPLLPSLSHNGSFEPVRAVDASLHGKTFGTAAGIPRFGRLVAIEVAASIVVVVLFAAD